LLFGNPSTISYMLIRSSSGISTNFGIANRHFSNNDERENKNHIQSPLKL